MELKQYCPYCTGKIAYPSEMAGSSTVCPHCRREVELAGEVKQECRACGEKVGFPESLLGESVACPHCGKSMKLHRSVADAFKQASAGRDTVSSVQYFLHMGGKVEGPLTEAEVCGLIEQGNIRSDTMARIGDANEWFPLGQLSQFTASFQKQTTAPAQEEAPTDEGPAEIMLMVKGAQHGPYTIGQIMHGLKTGTVDSHTPANRPGLPGWLPLKKWGEFENLEVVKALGAGSKSSKNQGFPCAMECLLTGLIFWAIELFLVVFRTGPFLSVLLIWLGALGWWMGRHMVYPDIGYEGDSSSISGQGARDWKIMGGMVFCGIFLGMRACTVVSQRDDASDIDAAAMLGAWTVILLILVPFGYLLVRGLKAGILFFFKQEKTISGWIINSIALLIHAVYLVFKLITVL